MKNEIKALQEKQEKISSKNKNQQLRIDGKVSKMTEKLEILETQFRNERQSFFTGKGFLTFSSFRMAHLFKMINDKMRKK